MTINNVNDKESLISPLLSQGDEEETLVPIGGDESTTCEGGLVSTWKSEEPNNVESDTVEDSSSSSSRHAWKSILLLNFVAILWGSQHAVIKSIVDDHSITPNEFSFFRFFLSTMIVAPYTPKCRKTWRWGAEMGLYMFAGYAMQAVGLQYTTAQKSGFLLYLNVKFVPILNAVIFRKRNKNIHVWLSAFIAFLGTALLACSPTTTTKEEEASSRMKINWNIGDLWSIGAAITSAMYIIRLEHALQQLEIEQGTAQLNSACLWVVTVLCLVWNLVLGDFSTFTPTTIQHLSHHIYPILYLSFIVTALANQIQSIGQRTLSAERASIIYAMDPVFGAIFSYLLLGEKLSFPWGYIGASLITIAAVTNALIEIMKKKQHKQETNPTDTTKS